MIYQCTKRAIILLCCFLISGCASLLTSSTQNLTGKPSGTSLEVYSWDGKLLASAKAPSEMTVSVHKPVRGQSYIVIAKAANKCPKYWLTSPKENPIGFANLLFGGIIGVIIDDNTGAGYLIDPDTYELSGSEDMSCAN